VTPAVALLKRALDVVGAAAGLALSAPLMAVVAVAIRLDSPGPILYRQRRAGQLLGTAGGGAHFVEFDILKFRTMCDGAEKGTGPVLAARKDSRVTRIGRLLRRTRIDEIPQFWNVLLGEMSLVGPRPERPELMDNLVQAIPFFEERMRGVRPGLTGLAQISLSYTGRPLPGDEILKYIETLTNPFKLEGTEGALADDMRIKLLYDLAYVASLESMAPFLRMEARILVRTPWVMIKALGQ
jgi:lipopolysaccharide/colanic/teichoic acid biosynthesis glycosyltransferase